jgi:nicotinamidase-related amidase
MKRALLIIDLQQEFFQDGRLKDHKENLIDNVNELVDLAHENDMPVVWVRQEYRTDLSDAPLFNRRNNKPVTIAGSEGCKLLSGLHRSINDNEIVKKRFSAFFNTDLENMSRKLGINSFIIAGINTMTCVRTTAIDAYQRDFEVILALDCVDAYDFEQHENSIKYLQYSVSKGMHNAEIAKLIPIN